jgi:chromate transporter
MIDQTTPLSPSGTPPSGPAALFIGFLGVGLLGFGGVLPFARRMIVEERRWLTAAEFTDLLALCQFLPGPNICNMTIALGRRFHGFPGAMAAILGLMGAPFIIAIGLGMVYARYGGIPAVAQLFLGLAAAASGLVLATAIKIATPLYGKQRVLGLVIAAVAFVAIAAVRTPLLPTMLVLAPVSVWLHMRATAVRA